MNSDLLVPQMARIAFDTIDLQRLQVGAQLSVDEMFYLHAPKLEQWREEILQRLVFTLRGYVWAEPPRSVSVRYPRTWWDAFKLRWFPKWALEAYPEDYTIETMEGQIFYPKLPTTVPEHAWNLRMAVYRGTPSVLERNEEQSAAQGIPKG